MRKNGAVAPRVFLTATAIQDDALQSLFKSLPPKRAALAKRLPDRAHFAASVLGFCLVRYALYAETGRIFEGDWQTAPEGKPYLEGAPCFNLSHTAHAVAVAIFDREVGVDIEEIKPHHQGLVARICTDAELARLNASCDQVLDLCLLWSAKEAEGKRLGTGLSSPRLLCLDTVKSTHVIAGGVPHVLSLSPTTADPLPLWVTYDQLFLSEG